MFVSALAEVVCAPARVELYKRLWGVHAAAAMGPSGRAARGVRICGTLLREILRGIGIFERRSLIRVGLSECEVRI
jgi:hypothetical protein